MQVTVTSELEQPYRQVVQSGTQTFFADEGLDKGGMGSAPEPFQMLLGAWGSCINMTVQMYAKRQGWALSAVSTTLTKIEATGAPTVEKNIRVEGRLQPEQIERLKRVSEKCPINQFITGIKTVRSNFEWIDPDA
jgi:putative redox protein